MIAVKVNILNLDKLRANFDRAPSLALSYLSKATTASIFELEKQAIDKNFQFRTPRSLRTGLLAQSFAYGRYIEPGGLRGSIGPTVKYAPYVYFGTRRGLQPNPYMDRIADAATPAINKHFTRAIDLFIGKLAS